MEIKRTLKNLDVRISRLAGDLGISRPTLDSYIDMYDSGKPLPNRMYQEIFDYLFSSENMTNVEFAKKYDYVKRNLLRKGVDRGQDRELTVRDRISDFAMEKDVRKEFLEFIDLFIRNRDAELVQRISEYFNYVNGLKELDPETLTEKERALYSRLYQTFSEYQSDSLVTDGDSYDAFVGKCRRVYGRKNTDPAGAELLAYLEKNLPEGSAVDLDYVKNLLEKKEELG